jgi:hypothetical protein
MPEIPITNKLVKNHPAMISIHRNNRTTLGANDHPTGSIEASHSAPTQRYYARSVHPSMRVLRAKSCDVFASGQSAIVQSNP